MLRPRALGLTALVLTLAACDEGGGNATPVDAAPDVAVGALDAVAPDARLVDAEPMVDAGPPDATPDAARPLQENFGVTETEGEPQCENLHPGHCLMPYPSDFFRVDTGDGPRLHFGADSLPIYRGDQHMTGEAFERADGFGGASPIMFTWPGATLAGTAPVFEPAQSLAPESPTVLLDADTGQRIPHWVEYDHLTLDRPGVEPIIVLRPAIALPRGHRIIVAIQGLRDADGAPVPATPAFAALRDQTASRYQGIHARRDRFEAQIFPALAAAGLLREQIQLAWDFTVATGPNGHDTLRIMRDRLEAAIGEDGPEYTIESVEPTGDEHIPWMMIGIARIPSFLGPPDAVGLRRHLLDAGGLPRLEGFEAVEFTVQIPRSAIAGDRPIGVLQYGHGFLGDKGQGEGGWLRSMADEYGFLILSADMQGMSSADFGVWIQILAGRPSEFPHLAEKAMQGVMNHLALQRLMKGRFLRETDERLTRDGQPLYDPTDLMYYGNSQGGTMGAVIMSVTPDVRRGVLGVPGCGFPLLLQRSVVFEDFVRILDLTFTSRTEFALVLALLGSGWDRLDPLTVAPHLTTDPLPDTPPHEVLLHVAKEDAQVHNQVSFILARSIGNIPVGLPLTQPTWGLDPQPLPYTGSMLTEFDFKHPDNPNPLTPPPLANDTHGDLRKLPAGQLQMMHFLRTGEVIDVCDGQTCRFDPP